jgi:hypothetical protein
MCLDFALYQRQAPRDLCSDSLHISREVNLPPGVLCTLELGRVDVSMQAAALMAMPTGRNPTEDGRD